tara:strand:- start:2203 stop:2700 length:498 start_codon:yes stop_codon:yes gene_type:complete
MYTTFKKGDIMVNAWALAASIMDGTFDEDYPIMTGIGTHSNQSRWEQVELGNVTIDMSNCPPEIEKPPVHYKYNEEKILEKIKDYIGRTYSSHYSYNERGVQTLDLIEAVGDAAAFCRSNILKYASRYDKKGTTRLDIEKIIHYAVLLYHFEGLDKEPTNGYETF